MSKKKAWALTKSYSKKVRQYKRTSRKTYLDLGVADADKVRQTDLKYRVKVHRDGEGWLMYSNEDLGMKIWSDTSWNTRYRQAKKAYYAWKAARCKFIKDQEDSGLDKLDISRQVRSFDIDWKIDKLHKELTKQIDVCIKWREAEDVNECQDMVEELHSCIEFDNGVF